MRTLSFILLCCLLFGYLASQAQPPLPKALVLDHIEEAYPQGKNDEGTPYYVQDTLFPIGWSQTGKLAYLKHDLASEMDAEHYCRLQVLDLNTDSVVYDLMEQTESTEAFWVNIQDSIWDILKRYEIRYHLDYEIRQFPARVSVNPGLPNDWVFLHTILDQSKPLDSDSGDSPVPFRPLMYEMEHTAKGKKVVFHTLSLPYDNWDHYIHGYLTSPFGNRIAIINTHCERLTCGCDQTGIRIHFIGSDLNRGYKP